MLLDQITLKGFRNYEDADIEFSNGVNVFLGSNAQGKTNMVEAIYFLALARSHRTSKDKELIGWDEEFAKVSGIVKNNRETFPLQITVSNKGKKAKVNYLEQPKLSQYIGHLNVIMFAPEDLDIVKGSPMVRRRFIDMELGQMSPLYLHHLLEYQKILKQRNQYLKLSNNENKFDKVYFDILTEQLANEASHVIYERYKFTDLLESWAQPIQEEISQSKENLSIQYVSAVDEEMSSQIESIYEELIQLYDKNFDKELYRQTTIIGPHRDDLEFYVNNRNVQTYGSQGQQRTTALSVKLAEIELMKHMTDEYPILLLDDVLSELDDNRQTHLLKAIQNKVQTFLTTTNINAVNIDLLNKPKIFNVSNGMINVDDTINDDKSKESAD